MADDMEHEGPAAGVVEGPACPSDGGGNEEEVGLDGPSEEDAQHGGNNGQGDEVGGHDDVSPVLPVADGAGEEGEGEHGDGTTEAHQSHLPWGAGELIDEPAHDEELGHVSAGGDAAVAQ